MGYFVDPMSEPLVQRGVPVWGVGPVDRPDVVPHTGRDAGMPPQFGCAVALVLTTQGHPSVHSTRCIK